MGYPIKINLNTWREIVNFINFSQDRDQWKDLVDTEINFRVQ
jgi:hypothetical protein